MSNQIVDLLNPFEFSAVQYVCVWAAKCVGVVVFDQFCLGLEKVWSRGKELGSRGKKLHLAHKARFQFGISDYAFLAINSLLELTFILNLTQLVFTSQNFVWKVGDATVLNTLGATFLVFVVDDCIYALWHRFMHWGPIYPLCHQHHHRQKFPEYGFFDGSNVHPIEEAAAVLIIYSAVHLVAQYLGFHIYAFAASFILFAFVNVANHSKFDITFNFFGPIGYQYTVGAHELHHRHYFVNYGKFCMWMDHIMGTYMPYVEDGSKSHQHSALR